MTGHPTTMALNRHNYIFYIFLLFFGSKMEFVLSELHKNHSEHSRLVIWAYHYCPRTNDDHLYSIYHFERTMGPCIEHFLQFCGYWNSPCRNDVFTTAVVVLLLFLLMQYSGVSIYKRSFDQLIIIRECEDTNYKTLTIFIFFNFNHLPFF